MNASLKMNFPDFSFEVTPYINYISNYIYAYLRGDTIDNLPVRQFSATNARLYGYEASIMAEPISNIAVEADANYVNAQDTKNNLPLPFIPPLHGFLRLTYQDNTIPARSSGNSLRARRGSVRETLTLRLRNCQRRSRREARFGRDGTRCQLALRQSFQPGIPRRPVCHKRFHTDAWTRPQVELRPDVLNYGASMQSPNRILSPFTSW